MLRDWSVTKGQEKKSLSKKGKIFTHLASNMKMKKTIGLNLFFVNVIDKNACHQI